MEENQKALNNDEKIDQSVQRILGENQAFAREHFNEQARLLAVYRMENFLPILTPFTGSVMKTDLARITLMLTGDTSIADQYLLKRDKFKLKEFSTALVEYAFRKAFPDAGNLLEKAGRLQAQAERSELQNAFLEKMLQLTETKGQLKSALADANAQNELSKLKERNRSLEEALKGKDAEIAEAAMRLQTAETRVRELKEKALHMEQQEKERTDNESRFCALLENVQSGLAVALDDERKTGSRLENIAKKLHDLEEMISALERTVAEKRKDAVSNAAILEKLEALDWIAAIVEDTNEHQDSQQIRDDLLGIRDLIQENIAQQKRSKGFFGRRRKLRKAESAEPDPELESLVVGILKNSEYTEGQLAIIEAAVEQGMRQGLSAADLSELADPKIPEDNMAKLARFLFLRRKLVFHAPNDANGGTAQDSRKEEGATEAKAGSLEEDYIV